MGPRPLKLVDTTMYWSRTGGGVARYVLNRAHWLTRQAGWQHALVVPQRSGGESTHTRCIETGGWPLPGRGWRVPWNVAALTERIVEQQPDLIEAGDPFAPAWAAVRARDACGTPIVAFCHGNPAAAAQRLLRTGARRLAALDRLGACAAGSLAGAYLRSVYRHFDLVLAPSLAMCEVLRGLGVEHVEHQPLGVDLEVFRPNLADRGWRRQLERSLGMEPGARIFLYAGRLAPQKNLQLLADAVGALNAHHYLLLLGHGPWLPWGEHVRFLPYERDSTQVARLMANVDAVVHAGDQEGFGLAVLEAMACATPVVVCGAGGLGELVRGDAGIGVAPGADAHTWAEALRAALDRPQERICNALVRSAGHDWRQVLPHLAARYRLLGAGAGAPVARLALDGALR